MRDTLAGVRQRVVTECCARERERGGGGGNQISRQWCARGLEHSCSWFLPTQRHAAPCTTRTSAKDCNLRVMW